MTTPVYLWRIAAETREYQAHDISGRGAAKYPGRWNAAGEHIVYAAETLALAVLETAAHLNDEGFPLKRFVIQLTVPLSIWETRQERGPSDLDPAWCSIPSGQVSTGIESAWYKSTASAILLVPSVIVPEESVVLIHATHPDAKYITAKAIRPFEFNKLFRR
ncbi:MAG: RES family NAD+ phosphorylase [Acidiferrobacter sp.]